MKKMLGVAIGGALLLAVAAALAVVGYRQGWFSRIGLIPPAGSGGGGVASGQGTGTNPPAETKGQALTGAGGGEAGVAAQTAEQGFDGNVAALAWGGKVESLTGMESYSASDVDWVSNLIDGDARHDLAHPGRGSRPDGNRAVVCRARFGANRRGQDLFPLQQGTP